MKIGCLLYQSLIIDYFSLIIKAENSYEYAKM